MQIIIEFYFFRRTMAPAEVFVGVGGGGGGKPQIYITIE